METLQTVEKDQNFYDKAFWSMVGTLGFTPEYSLIPPDTDDPKMWQKISDATGTVVTPANAIDLLCFAGAKYGIDNLDSWKGIGIAAVSFLGDLVDGKVARATGTQSELGEALDAAGDKIKLAYALVKIWQMDLAPKPLLVAVALQNGLNAGLTLADQALHKENPAIHASWFGKRAIFLQQTGIGLHVIGSQLEKEERSTAKTVKLTGNVLGYTGVAVGTVASGDYLHKFVQTRRSKR